MEKQTTSFILGLMGGIFGFFGGIFALGVGGIGEAFNLNDAGTLTALGIVAILFSIVAIISSVLVKTKPKLGGWIMLFSGIIILFAISLFGLLPSVLLIIGGIIGLNSSKKK